MHHAAYDVQQDLRGKDRGRAAPVVIGRDLDEVHSDHLSASRKPGHELQHLVIEEPAMRWRARARARVASIPIARTWRTERMSEPIARAAS